MSTFSPPSRRRRVASAAPLKTVEHGATKAVRWYAPGIPNNPLAKSGGLATITLENHSKLVIGSCTSTVWTLRAPCCFHLRPLAPSQPLYFVGCARKTKTRRLILGKMKSSPSFKILTLMWISVTSLFLLAISISSVFILLLCQNPSRNLNNIIMGYVYLNSYWFYQLNSYLH